ncbi:hypothetical protein [Streptomyces sp. cg36]|uniref:hypothetical protein n=1 Tax=Streptomyces sp. cg36 TaxID=3238798 RepID=UPI0034E1A69B
MTACAAAAVVLAGLTACTAQQADKAAKPPVRSAKAAASSARATVLAALARTTSKTDHAQSATITATITGAGQPAPMTASGTYTWGGDAPAFDTVIDTRSSGVSDLRADGHTRMLFVDGGYYYLIDPQKTGPFTGKHWLKVDASAVIGQQGKAAIGRGSSDPTVGLKALKGARDVLDLGTETVRGRATRHYLVRVGPSQWGEAGDALTGRTKDSQMGGYTGDVKEITIGLWVDPRTDLPVRMEETIGTAQVKIDFKSFGGPKTITAPRTSDIVDITDEVKGQSPQDSDDETTAGQDQTRI